MSFNFMTLFLPVMFFCLFSGSQLFAADVEDTITKLERKEKNYPLVREIQSLLNYCGYDVGMVDGLWGPKTAAAIREFQKERNMIPDGQPGTVLLSELKDRAEKYKSAEKAHFLGSYRESKAIRVYDNGDRYEGGFYAGMRQGQGKLWQKNGNVYEGYWYRNNRDGYGRQDFADGRIYEGEWSGDMPKGRGIYTLADGRAMRGVWEEGVLISQALPLQPFGDILWEDSLAEIIAKLQKAEGIRKIMLSHSYNPAAFLPVGTSEKPAGFVDLSAVSPDSGLRDKLGELTGLPVEYYSGSAKMQGALPWKEYSGVDEKFVEGVVIRAWPVYLEGIPFELRMHLSASPGLFMAKPQNTLRDDNGYLFSLILTELTLYSRVQLSPDLYSPSRVSDKWEDILSAINRRHAYWYIPEKGVFADDREAVLRTDGFDKSWSEKRSIVYSSSRYFRELQSVWESRNSLQKFSDIDLSDKL